MFTCCESSHFGRIYSVCFWKKHISGMQYYSSVVLRCKISCENVQYFFLFRYGRTISTVFLSTYSSQIRKGVFCGKYSIVWKFHEIPLLGTSIYIKCMSAKFTSFRTAVSLLRIRFDRFLQLFRPYFDAFYSQCLLYFVELQLFNTSFKNRIYVVGSPCSFKG